MARWLVTKGDHQFSAANLAELKRLAGEGRIGPGDMIQPPGAADWMYAAELEELTPFLGDGAPVTPPDDDLDYKKKGLSTGVLVALLAAVVLVGSVTMYYFALGLKDANYDLLGGEGLALTEMLVTEADAPLRSTPEDNGQIVEKLQQDSKVQLIAKRGDWYQAQSSKGVKGWVHVQDVIPAYFFADEETRQDYDPIYNPDRYVFVKNSSWMQLPDAQAHNVTVFEFLLQNKSKFKMTDLVLKATIKDKDDRVLETKEIAIEGSVEPYANAWVGTLKPPEDVPAAQAAPRRLMTDVLFKQIAKDDPELYNRWVEGIEVPMQSEGFIEANIDLIQIRAVPKKL